jgi:predicted ribosome quality control (RQC) complex YloA/Tae2 family protein
LSLEKGAMMATKQLYKGMAKDMLKYIESQNIDSLPIPDQFEKIKAFENILKHGTIDVCEKNDGNNKSIYLTLLPSDEDKAIESTNDVIVATDSYARNYYFTNYFSELKNSRLAKLSLKSEKTNQQLKAARHHLLHLENESNYKKQADIIMANLHQIPEGAETVILFDFYTGKNVDMPLKRGLSPQRWAEKLYTKAKNQVIEKQKTMERINQLENEWLVLSEETEKIKAIEDIRDLQMMQKVEKKNPEKEISPFRHFNFEGYDIYVGKNASNNDKLTFGFAHKEDLWLHASGVSGSHVIIKHKQKTIFPEPVIIQAARLAAFNSRSKGSILVPVIYTLKKFVRKPKGAAPGAVICEQEKMIMAEPGI